MNETKQALLETYLARREELKRFLAARLGDNEAAADLVQELFIRIERADGFGDIQNAAAYLFTMAANLAKDHRRERQRTRLRDGQWVEASWAMVGTEPVAMLPTPEASIHAKQRLEAIVSSIDELSPQCRRVFVLHKFEGLTHLEVAARVGITRSTVEKHMTTALKHLVRRLGRD